MNILLFETAQYYNHYRIVMIMDSAGWHTTKNLELPENITVLPLPPYSPQLNPVEHIWDYIREQKKFNNHSFNSLNDVEIQLCKVLCDLHNEKEIMKSMCNFNWINSVTC
jgi:transposase